MYHAQTLRYMFHVYMFVSVYVVATHFLRGVTHEPQSTRVRTPDGRPSMEYPPCASPLGAYSASWSDKGVSHTSCRHERLSFINRSFVSSTERLVHSSFCSAGGAACPSVRDIVLALLASNDERGFARCANVSPSDTLNLVFIGDSISFRSFNAAACSLLAGKQHEISPPQCVPPLPNHRRYRHRMNAKHLLYAFGTP